LLAVAEKLRYEHGINKVGLSGGVFQNALLLAMVVSLLQASGFVVLVHAQVPANDGGIALGQACLASQAGLEG
jgi:hydrogenase maturation protein HypF